MIHPTAVIHPKAEIASNVTVGACAVIDEGVLVGPGTVIGPHAYLTGRTRIGANNRFHAGCVIGDLPQDIRFKGEPTELIIGEGNTFREHVTIHRSNNLQEPTRIGNANFLMANAHVGHNSHLADNIIIANGALIAGHVTISDRVFISGNCLVHQFVRIGKFAFMQGGSGVSKDLPPFSVARGDNGICGLNTVGLRRAGFTSAQRLELRKLYHQLFRSGKPLRLSLAEVDPLFSSELTREMIDFIKSSKRGVVAERRKGVMPEEASDDEELA
ncbi:MAG: acyl-ACP--UDP-N-acetylglucosamine O-acyltransferase [Verrucomicrobiales bacterium]